MKAKTSVGAWSVTVEMHSTVSAAVFSTWGVIGGIGKVCSSEARMTFFVHSGGSVSGSEACSVVGKVRLCCVVTAIVRVVGLYVVQTLVWLLNCRSVMTLKQ